MENTRGGFFIGAPFVLYIWVFRGVLGLLLFVQLVLALAELFETTEKHQELRVAAFICGFSYVILHIAAYVDRYKYRSEDLTKWQETGRHWHHLCACSWLF